jgi:SAM-dependent methyltransferase
MIKGIYRKIVSEKNRNVIRRFFQKLTYPLYLGNNFYCNCCNKSFRKFLPKGNIKRLNAKCPYCLSLERVRLLDLYLTNEIGLFKKKGIKVLHIAPEDILFKKIAPLDIEYIDGDINPANSRYLVDVTNIQFNDNYFDLIICSHVLGHVPNEELALHELKRVLKNDGVALFMSLLNPNERNTLEDARIVSPEDRLKFYGEPDLCRLYGTDFGDRLAKQGFIVERIDYREKLPKETLVRNSLGNGEREIIYKCTK